MFSTLENLERSKNGRIPPNPNQTQNLVENQSSSADVTEQESYGGGFEMLIYFFIFGWIDLNFNVARI